MTVLQYLTILQCLTVLQYSTVGDTTIVEIQLGRKSQKSSNFERAYLHRKKVLREILHSRHEDIPLLRTQTLRLGVRPVGGIVVYAQRSRDAHSQIRLVRGMTRLPRTLL